MDRIQYDPEIVYVQKLYFFLFLTTFFFCASLILLWKLGLGPAVVFFLLGLAISYLLMVKKNSFPIPAKKVSAQRMAKEISQKTSPLVVSRFASQLCFYFNETELAISLLEKFLPTKDPLVCATLSDILLREGKVKQALVVLRENPEALVNPLLLALQGHVYKRLGRTNEAIKMYERSLYFAKKNGFPHNGAHWLTQKFLTLSYTASIHHALGKCYWEQNNYKKSKRHFWAGNLRLLDVTLWQYPNKEKLYSLKSYRKSQ